MSVFSAFIYADVTQHQRSQIERTMIATAAMPHDQSLPFLQGFRHHQQRTRLSVFVPPCTPLLTASENFVRTGVQWTIFLRFIRHCLHLPLIEESVSQSGIDMTHDLHRESTQILPVIGHINDPYLFALHHARLQITPSDSHMGRHFQPFELCGQGYNNAGGRELISHVVLNDDSRAFAALNMTGRRDRHINEYHISTLIRFHFVYLLYLVTLLTISSTSERSSGGLHATLLAYNSSLKISALL